MDGLFSFATEYIGRGPGGIRFGGGRVIGKFVPLTLGNRGGGIDKSIGGTKGIPCAGRTNLVLGVCPCPLS